MPRSLTTTRLWNLTHRWHSGLRRPHSLRRYQWLASGRSHAQRLASVWQLVLQLLWRWLLRLLRWLLLLRRLLLLLDCVRRLRRQRLALLHVRRWRSSLHLLAWHWRTIGIGSRRSGTLAWRPCSRRRLLLWLHGRLPWRRSSRCSRRPNGWPWRWLLLCRLQRLLHLHGNGLVPRQQPIGRDLCAKQIHLVVVQVLVLGGGPHGKQLRVAWILLQALLLHRVDGALQGVQVLLAGAFRWRWAAWRATRRHYAGLSGSLAMEGKIQFRFYIRLGYGVSETYFSFHCL